VSELRKSRLKLQEGQSRERQDQNYKSRQASRTFV